MRSSLALSCVLALLACERTPVGDGTAERELERERVPVAREHVSTPHAAAFNEALDAIAAARCAHELRCGTVGHAVTAACRSTVRTSLSDDMVPADCPTGVDRAMLGACVKAVRDEGCGTALDSLARVQPCRVATLCPRGEQRVSSAAGASASGGR